MENELINILCYKLPGDLSRAVHKEYENRWNEIQRILVYPKTRFKVLENYPKTLQCLLAMSTFYRRVLSGMEGASDFYKTVNKDVSNNRCRPIAIGKYRLDKEEYNKLLAIHISFQKMREKFGINEQLFEYTETEEFLTNCKDYYYSLDVKPTPGIFDSTPDEDLPF